MRIYFERSGGFLGLRLASVVDTDSLNEDEALSLRSMVDACSFFDLPPTPSSPPEGADQFSYKLVVEDGDRQHSVETTDSLAPDELRPLLRRLTVLARSNRGFPH